MNDEEDYIRSVNPSGMAAVTDQIAAQQAIDNDSPEIFGLLRQFFTGVADIDNMVSPWWSRRRDMELQGVWQDGGPLSGIMGLAAGKLASLRLRVLPKDPTNALHVRRAQQFTDVLEMNMGDGWFQTITRFAQDYLGADNGGFLAINGETEGGMDRTDLPINGWPYGVATLDTMHCERTNDPLYPIIYTTPSGERKKYHISRVISLSQQPSARRDMYGVGFCSVSRSLRIAKTVTTVHNFMSGRMGGKDIARILVGRGIGSDEILKSIAAGRHIMDELNLRGFLNTVAIGSRSTDVGLDKVELADFEQFDERASFEIAMLGLGLAWHLEPHEILPVFAGSRQSEAISMVRGRAKLPAQFATPFVQQANLKLVPDAYYVELEIVDDNKDQATAVAFDIAARGLQRLMASGAFKELDAQHYLFENGFIARPHYEGNLLAKGLLPDERPVGTLFFDPNYSQLLLVDRSFLVPEDSDPVEARKAIQANRAAIFAIMASSSGRFGTVRAKQALAALDWLETLYPKSNPLGLAPMENEPQEQEEEPEEEQEERPIPKDGRLTGADQGR